MRFLPILALVVAVFAPLRGVEDVPLLGAPEAAFVAKYGQPRPYPVMIRPPVTKGKMFKVDVVMLVADFIDDRCVRLMASNAAGPLGDVQIKQILARCGGEWKVEKNRWVRTDGAFAEKENGALFVTSPELPKTNEKDATTRPIKGL